MKILKKRAIACFIDAFIYSSLLEGLRFLIPDVINFWIKIPILGITIFLPFFAISLFRQLPAVKVPEK